MTPDAAKALADRLEHFYLLTGDEGQALLVEVMAALRSVPVTLPSECSNCAAMWQTIEILELRHHVPPSKQNAEVTRRFGDVTDPREKNALGNGFLQGVDFTTAYFHAFRTHADSEAERLAASPATDRDDEPELSDDADVLEHLRALSVRIEDENDARIIRWAARRIRRYRRDEEQNSSQLRASGATSSGSDEETIERVCTAIAAIGSNLTAWNLRRIAVAAIEAVAPNGRGVANDTDAVPTLCPGEDARDCGPEPAPSEDEREALHSAWMHFVSEVQRRVPSLSWDDDCFADTMNEAFVTAIRSSAPSEDDACACETDARGREWYCHLHRDAPSPRLDGLARWRVPNPRMMHFTDGRRILKPHIETTYCAKHGCVPVHRTKPQADHAALIAEARQMLPPATADLSMRERMMHRLADALEGKEAQHHG